MKTTYLFMLCLFIQYGLKAQTNITWTNAKNINIKGGKLIKNGDVKAWWNAGIASEEYISANTDGWVKAVVTKPKGAKILGLSSQNEETAWNTVEYGLYVMGNGTIQILEKGKIIFTSKVKVNKGDLIQVERKSDQIRYKKNNDVVYTSKKKSTSVLFADISMYAPGAEFSGLSIYSNEEKRKGTTVVAGPLNFEKIHTTISISYCTDADIAALNQLENKNELEFQLNSNITQEDFDKICTDLPWIRKFDFESSLGSLNNIDALKNLKMLEKIDFSYSDKTEGNPIDLSVIKDAENIKVLESNVIHLTNSSTLEGLINLEKVILKYGSIDSHNFLRGKTGIKELQISNVNDNQELYTIIGELKALENLHLEKGEKIITTENLKPLAGLKNLKWLFIPGNSFSEDPLDITSLGEMTALETLFISDYKVDDLTPLMACKSLSFIKVHKGTTEEQIKKLQTSLPELEINVSKF